MILTSTLKEAVLRLTMNISQPLMHGGLLIGTALLLVFAIRRMFSKERNSPSPLLYIGGMLTSIGAIALVTFLLASEDILGSSIFVKIVLSLVYGGGLTGFIVCARHLETNQEETD